MNELVQWSSSKVKQAMQQLLEPEGGLSELAVMGQLVAAVAWRTFSAVQKMNVRVLHLPAAS